MEPRDFEFTLFPILSSQSAVDYFSDMMGECLSVTTWADQTFHPRNRKYVVDLVGECEDGRLLHIEQETSPDSDLQVRMLEYAALIAIRHRLLRPITQIVFYTGDARRNWPGTSKHRNGLLYEETSLGYLQHRYLVIDAGEPEKTELAKASFPAAALVCWLAMKKWRRPSWRCWQTGSGR
jgi:hypothetical protein